MPYLVMGAGDAEFDGFYEVDTTRIGGKRDRIDSAACYRKVGSSCTMNYNRTDHAWFMCKDHRGAWYKNTTESDVPPASGWTRANQGKAPPPTIQFAGCVGLLSVQPLALRVKQTRVPGTSVDGLYVIDVEKGETDGVACYRRVNSSETLHRHNGTWYISTRYDHRSASWFEASAPMRTSAPLACSIPACPTARLAPPPPPPPPRKLRAVAFRLVLCFPQEVTLWLTHARAPSSLRAPTRCPCLTRSRGAWCCRWLRRRGCHLLWAGVSV